MNRVEFEREWTKKVTKPYEKLKRSDWHKYAASQCKLLSLEAKQFIVDNPNTFGDWMIEAVFPDTLEAALGLEVV